MKLRAPVNIKMLPNAQTGSQPKQTKALRRYRRAARGEGREGSTFSQVAACPEESHNSFMQKSIDI